MQPHHAVMKPAATRSIFVIAMADADIEISVTHRQGQKS